jgi:hypothetical protein
MLCQIPADWPGAVATARLRRSNCVEGSAAVSLIRRERGQRADVPMSPAITCAIGFCSSAVEEGALPDPKGS